MEQRSAQVLMCVCVVVFPLLDDASGVHYGPALRATSPGGVTVVSGASLYRHLLPGHRGVELPADLRQDHRQRPTVSVTAGGRVRVFEGGQ